jgi:hypothetical protein
MSRSQDLKQLVRRKYPFPISHAYAYLESRADPDDRYQAILSCFEVTLKSITSITLANFMRDIQDDPKLGNAHLFQDLVDMLSRPLSLGHWQELLRLTLRPYAKRREHLVVPELFDFYYRVTEHGNIKTQSQNVRILQRFIQERNEEAHHRSRGQFSAFQRLMALDELIEAVQNLLHELAFLAKYPLLYVEYAEHREGRWHYQANFAQGSSYPFPQRMWETDLSVNSHRCLLVDEVEPAVLELDPFVIVTSEGRLQQPDIFFFDGVFSSGQANFMSYHVGDYIEPTDEGSPASVASDTISSLLKLLENRIPPAIEETGEVGEEPFSPAEIYREAADWASGHGRRQTVTLDALRSILGLSREEALQEEHDLDAERGIEIESEEIEVPFEGKPTWANLAYYVLDNSGQSEMFYKDIAAEAEALKDQEDPNWQEGDSAHVAGTVSRIMSQDSRFYKLRRGHYRLTKNNDLLSNPSWANLAYFVLKHNDPENQGMHLQEITDEALTLKEKHSDWHSESVQTPSHTVSATMSMDHRFESMTERGYWRLATEEPQPAPVSEALDAPTTRHQAYQDVLDHLAGLGEVTNLPFGRTYYAINGRVHLMFRFSKAHERNDEIEYFLGVTPQYFERIDDLGNGFMVFVLGTSDNVLLVPTRDFSEWVQGMEPSGSGTWPMSFYQSEDGTRLERWLPGEGREDVSKYRNDYDSIRHALTRDSVESTERCEKPLRVSDLLEAGLLRPGDTVHTRKHPDIHATVIDSWFVEYQGEQWRYNDWGAEVNEWAAINIYCEFVLARTGETLNELRKKLRYNRSK